MVCFQFILYYTLVLLLCVYLIDYFLTSIRSFSFSFCRSHECCALVLDFRTLYRVGLNIYILFKCFSLPFLIYLLLVFFFAAERFECEQKIKEKNFYYYFFNMFMTYCAHTFHFTAIKFYYI